MWINKIIEQNYDDGLIMNENIKTFIKVDKDIKNQLIGTKMYANNPLVQPCFSLTYFPKLSNFDDDVTESSKP